jgi:uncharacterized protein YwgA
VIEENTIPILLAKALGQIRGKTRFQKLVFIIQNLAMQQHVESPSFQYVSYLYGPFSAQLAGIIDNLQLSGYLKQTTETSDSGYSTFIYELTPQGVELAHRTLQRGVLDRRLVDLVNGVAKEFGNTPLALLVETAKGMQSSLP